MPYDDEYVNKSQDEVINCYIEFAEWLNSGASLSTLVSVVSSGDETISNTSISGTKILMTISNGSCGNKTITATVTTSDDETLIGRVKLRNRQ